MKLVLKGQLNSVFHVKSKKKDKLGWPSWNLLPMTYWLVSKLMRHTAFFKGHKTSTIKVMCYAVEVEFKS